MIAFGTRPDLMGHFPISDDSPDAIPKGTRIVKINSEHNDMTADGTLGTVLGSVDAKKVAPRVVAQTGVRFMYWVVWDDKPAAAVAIVERKIARAS